jgi:Pentapeptide repeats (8 copies)
MKILQIDTGKVLWEDPGRADLTRADLTRANLTRANLYDADLTDANLYAADLTDADLTRANLTGANLNGANLTRANLIVGGYRSDGYQFMLFRELYGMIMVRAGCRYFTIDAARKHWKKTRADTRLGSESQVLVDGLEAMAKIAGWIK